MSYFTNITGINTPPDTENSTPQMTISAPSATTVGKPHGIAATANSVGKPGRTEHLGTVVGRRGAGISSLGGGNPAMHSLNHYGKNMPPGLGGGPSGGVNPTSHAGAQMVRGGAGKMRSHVREGGIGPGRMATPGANAPANYSVTDNSDIE